MNASSQLSEKKGLTEAIYKNWDKLSAAQKSLDEVGPQIDTLNQSLINKDEPIDFINTLENLARDTDNIFEINLTNSQADPKKKEDALFFQIKLAGSFSNAMHFLNYLENMKYRAQIQSLDISKTGTIVFESSENKEIPPGSVYTTIGLKAFTQ